MARWSALRKIHKKAFSMACLEERLNLPSGGYLGYKQYKPLTPSCKPGVIFCHGWASSMNGIKANYLFEFCRKNGVVYTSFDYIGHENSSGGREDKKIGTWVQNTIDILDNVTEGPQILVGSSAGGWVALQVAMRKPDRVHSILSIANAADFIYQLFLEKTQNKSPGDIFDETDHVRIRDDIELSRSCIEDAQIHRVLGSAIPIHCPAILLHGMDDDVIPYQNSIRIAEKLNSSNVTVHLIKEADHRFCKSEHMEIMTEFLKKLLAN